MTTDRGSSSGSSSGSSGSASLSRDRLRPGDAGYQNVTDNTPNTGGAVSGELSLASSRSDNSGNVKDFTSLPATSMAPLTFPTPAISLEQTGSIPNGFGGAPTQDASTPVALDTTVSGASDGPLAAVASSVSEAAPRPAAINNNFTSLASRAGSKRSLIGGA